MVKIKDVYVKSQGYSAVLLITILHDALSADRIPGYCGSESYYEKEYYEKRKNNYSAGHDEPLTVPIEDLSEELFHFYFTLRILGLSNLNIKAKYVNKAVDTAVTTAVCSLQTLFRKKINHVIQMLQFHW